MDIPLGKGDRDAGLLEFPVDCLVKCVSNRHSIRNVAQKHVQLEVQAIVPETGKDDIVLPASLRTRGCSRAILFRISFTKAVSVP